MGRATALPQFAVLQAEPGWRSVDFISDLHLQPGEAATVDAWRRYLLDTPADALFILGDLFEAWVGDDAARVPGFAAECTQALREASAARPTFFMHGNRDFLVGAEWAADAGVRLLDDPTVLEFAGQRWLLTHGDLLCLADQAYLEFRAQVRLAIWRNEFLARPLAEREAVAQGMREASRNHQRALPTYADVDEPAAREWLAATGAQTLVHGHTHRPGDHKLGDGLRRIVLSDWDAQSEPPRLQALRLSASGELTRVDIEPGA
ncbi:MAG TPA: UDP-2,3-diacylglucosamine diphosphatase [Ramlibacter sp.]|nr:UDP-2,3-diacylglucosamine diphosphatase [Ramlibacter sp.]